MYIYVCVAVNYRTMFLVGTLASLAIMILMAAGFSESSNREGTNLLLSKKDELRDIRSEQVA